MGETKSAEAWRTPNEVCRQIRLNRTISEVKGSVYFSMRSLMNNLQGVCDSLRTDYYRYPALPPAALPLAPAALPPDSIQLTGHVLTWRTQNTDAPHHRYAVYGFPIGEEADFDNPRYILGVTAEQSMLIDEPDRYSAICVTEINQYKQESAPCILQN